MLTILDTSDDHHVLKACTMSSTKGLFRLGFCDQSYTQRALITAPYHRALFLDAGSVNFHWRAAYALKIYNPIRNFWKRCSHGQKIDVIGWCVTIDSQRSHLLKLVNAGPIGHRAVR
jgi:hypothetical protein